MLNSNKNCDCSFNYNFVKLAFKTVSMTVAKTATKTNTSQEEVMENDSSNFYQLIVWNDDVNTFEWVIKSLMEICGHTYEQAEQCSLIIHHNGKYKVKQDAYTVLKPMKDGLIDRGIKATLESSVK